MSRDNSRQRAAVRRAREVRAERERARRVREDQIEQALARYFAASAEMDGVRAAARKKADAVLADGERAVTRPYATACEALAALRDLLGSNSAVADLCGLRADDVREMLAATRSQQTPGECVTRLPDEALPESWDSVDVGMCLRGLAKALPWLQYQPVIATVSNRAGNAKGRARRADSGPLSGRPADDLMNAHIGRLGTSQLPDCVIGLNGRSMSPRSGVASAVGGDMKRMPVDGTLDSQQEA